MLIQAVCGVLQVPLLSTRKFFRHDSIDSSQSAIVHLEHPCIFTGYSFVGITVLDYSAWQAII